MLDLSSGSTTSVRRMGRALKLGASCLALAQAVFPGAANAFYPIPNTNACIADLGGLEACQERGPLGLPTDLRACCDGVRQLARDRCECNPAIDVLLGEGGDAIYDIEPICRIVQPLKWAFVPARQKRSCALLESRSSYRCGPWWKRTPDMEIDAARLESLLSLSSLFADANPDECFDVEQLNGSLQAIFEPDGQLFVPYGIGTYSDYDGISEYLGIAFPQVNHGFWQATFVADRSLGGVLNVSEDGKRWVSGAYMDGSFFDGEVGYDDYYVEQVAEFDRCEVRIQEYEVVATEGMRNWAERFALGARASDRWGARDICDYHERYCAADEDGDGLYDGGPLQQYDTYGECMDYVSALPDFSAACGQNRPLQGEALSCKLKHHFMVAINPTEHCNHIGREGGVRPDGTPGRKCVDAIECPVEAPCDGDSRNSNCWPLAGAGGGEGTTAGTSGLYYDFFPADVQAVADADGSGNPNEPNICR